MDNTYSNLDTSSMFYTIIILIIPLVVYINSLNTVTNDDKIWYLESSKEFKIPDFQFTNSGLLIGTIATIFFGTTLVLVGQLLIKNYYSDTVILSKNCFDRILFFLIPLILLFYGLSFPLMCWTKSLITGGIIMLIAAILSIIFTLYIIFRYGFQFGIYSLMFSIIITLSSVSLFIQ